MPQFGVWRITQAGRDWLSQNPDATHLGDPPQRSMPAAPAKDPRTPTSSGRGCRTFRYHAGQAGAHSPGDVRRRVQAGLGRYLRSTARRRARQDHHAPQRPLPSGSNSPARSAHSGLPPGARKREPKVRGYLRLDLHLLYPGVASRRLLPFGATSTRTRSTPMYERTKKLAGACRARLGV